jgi:uncharacterized repeat protein (TIGR03943 family)
MKEIRFSLFKYLIMLGLAAFLADKYFGGKLWLYINEKFFPLTIFAFILLSLMAVVEIYSIITIEQQDEGFALPDGILRNRQVLRQAQDAAQGTAQGSDFSKGMLRTLRQAQGTALRQAQGLESPNKNFQETRKIVFAALFTILPIAAAAVFRSHNITMIAYLVACNYGAVTALIKTNGQDKAQLTQKNIYSLIILALPLVIGLLSPEQSLSASALSSKGVSLNTSISASQASSISFDVQMDERTILDWIRLFNDGDDPSAYIGQHVDVVGLVYHDPRLPDNQFMVSRFVITCCAADAFAIGMTVNWTGSAELEDNTWVRVEGSLDTLQIDGDSAPLIQASQVELIPAPEQPYLYP